MSFLARERMAQSRRTASPRGLPWTGKAEFSSAVAKPQGQEPNLGAARPDSGAQMEQIEMAAAAE